MHKSKCMVALFFILITGLLLTYTGAAQSIVGTVTDEQGRLITGAAIRLIGTSLGAVSKADGSFELLNIPPGKYAVEATFIGHTSYKDSVQVGSQRVANLRIILITSAVEAREIVVTAGRRQEQTDTRPSLVAITPREAKFKAGAAEDVFRALQGLPGVTAPNDFSSQLVIRGSGPDQNLILMDGIELFNPYRLYGFISLFNPETVSSINLITGGFPAMYSDRLSAVLDVTNRDGSRDSGYFAGKMNVSVTNANLVTEGALPFADGAWLLSSRRTYYDLIAGPIAKAAGAFDGDVALPNFGDVQLRLMMQPWEEHRIIVNGLVSSDNTQFQSGENRKQADSISIVDRSYNSVAGLTWLYTPSTTFNSRLILSWYENTGSNNFGGEGGSMRIAGEETTREEFTRLQDSLRREGMEIPTLYTINGNSNFTFRKSSLRLDQQWRPSAKNTLEYGFIVDDITTGVGFELDIDPRLKALQQSNPRMSAIPESFTADISFLRLGAYLQDSYRLTEQLTVQSGLRYDFFEYINKHYVSPRLSTAYAIDPITTIRAAGGLYYQSPGYEKLFDRQVFLDFTDPRTRELDAERSIHGILGLERMITDEWIFRTEVYYKDFSDLILQQKALGTVYEVERVPGGDPTKESGWTKPVATLGDSLTALPVNSATGASYGIEFMFQKVATVGNSALYGWASYALSWSNRFRDGYTIPFNFDRRHALNISGGYRLNPNWDFSITFTYGSGFPWTDPVGITPRVTMREDPVTGDLQPELEKTWKGLDLQVDRGGINNINQGRLPDYHRLDVRATTYPEWFGLNWSVYLDVINIYNRRNIISRSWLVDSTTGDLVERETSMLPILPTLGFSVSW